MKKIIILTLCAASVSVASAQYYKTNILGLRAGLNASLQSMTVGGVAGGNVNRSAKLGWNVGISDQILLSQNLPFYFETGLYLSNKGSRRSSDTTAAGVTTSASSTVGITYLQIPLRVNYHFDIGDFTIEPYFGFYYGLGLWGRLVEKTEVADSENPTLNVQTKKVTDVFKDNDIRRSDMGVGLGLGASWSDFYAALGWERGFLNLSKRSEEKIYNVSNFTVTLGYNF